jgi:guanylate kinase
VSDSVHQKDAEPIEATAAWYDGLTCVRPLMVVISGPSGVGKDAAIQRMKERGYPCHFVVTVTSRAPRPGEVDGTDYHFVSDAEFQALIARDEMLEHALVYGQYKGIPKSGVRAALESGCDVIMRVDVQGARTVQRLVPQAVTIFLTAGSEAELVERLKRRRTEDEAQLQRRIETARNELQQAFLFKYRVVNRECSLNATVDAVLAIIQAEKSRVDWQPVVIG